MGQEEKMRAELAAEIKEKERRLRGLLEGRGAEAVLLARRDNFSWFTGGASNHVGQATELGVASLLVSRDRKWVICDNIEAGRILDEEVGEQGYELASFPWYGGSAAEQVSKLVAGRVISDLGAGEANAADEIARLRWSLTPGEVARYRVVGELVSRALSQAAHALRPGMSEHQIASLICTPLIAEGVQPTVVLVAVDGRIDRYRHPIPTDARLEQRAMLVVCGRKWGLIVSATRMVSMGLPSAELRRKHQAVVRVDEAFIGNSVPGRPVGEVFQAALAVYAAAGCGEEWQLHHQGGPTGYAGREYRANANTPHPVLENQAFAWNPSITGTKSEDTIIATGAGPVAVSWPYDYPTIVLTSTGREVTRADILVL